MAIMSVSRWLFFTGLVCFIFLIFCIFQVDAYPENIGVCYPVAQSLVSYAVGSVRAAEAPGDEDESLSPLPGLHQAEDDLAGVGPVGVMHQSVPRIFLDPGHGGRDSGAIGYVVEKEMCLIFGLALQEALSNYLCEIRMSRTTDIYLSLQERTDMANRWNADFYFSLHSNAFNGIASGYEDFIFDGRVGEATRRYQDVIHRRVARVWTDAGRPNRGKKRANFHVLRETRMPAMLVENGFVDNYQDAMLLKSPIFREKLTEAMALGIIEALQLRAVNIRVASINHDIIVLSEAGDTFVLDYTLTPPEAGTRALPWKSDNPGVADVDENGIVTAKGPGETLIRLGGNYGKEDIICAVTVGLDDVLPGDINQDGEVTVGDAVLLLRYLVKIDQLSPRQMQAADFNGNGLINISDAVSILHQIVGIQEE